jgi:PAS domain S-box-containing protein
MPTESHTESVALRTALRELVALSTIPAAWVGREPPIIAAGLAEVLLGSLQLDFAFVRLCDPKGGAAIEVMRGYAWKAFPEWLQTHPGVVGQFSCKEIVADLGGAEPCRGVVIPIGVNAEAGLVAAASTRTDFPSEMDQLLLSVAANHAAAAFQNARLRHELDAKVAELRQARNELEMKVSERTADLQRSEVYLAEAQRLSHCGSFALNVRGEGIYWSEETYRIFECDRANEPTLEFILQRTHPEDRALVRRVSNRAQQERKHFHFEHRLLMPNGSVKHIEVVAHAVERDESDNIGFVGAVLDVTERKRAEEALRRSEAYLADAQRLTHTGSWACNIATREMRHSSEEHSRLYGFDPEKGIPSFEEFVQRMHPEDRSRFVEIAERANSAGKDFDVHLRVVLPDGTTKYLYGVGHPVFNPSGDLVEFVGTAMDVTERRRADEERERLRQVQADLAHLSRVTTMGELTASLAHEIKQPITAAVTNAKACLRWLGRDEPNVAEACEAASRLVKDVTRAADIISRISLLFKKGALQRELVDVNELIREMIVLLRSEANRYSISIRTELAEDLPKVMADRVQLQQVFMNLMLNGIEAMKETSGGSELTIKSEADDAQLRVSVKDTGVGLPPEQADQIFTAFFTTKDNGTGMGLPISRSIIESHGGRLWFTGNSGRGATFHFTLPATVAAHP